MTPQTTETLRPAIAESPGSAGPSRRERVGAWVTGSRVSNLILGLILLNAVTLGLQTSSVVVREIGGPLEAVNAAILAVFVIELSLKLYAFRLGFFRSGWNVFDLVIVSVSLVPATGGLEVLRTLRVLRLLRLVSQVPKLREIVEAIGRSLTGLMWTAALLGLVFYIFGVMGTMLFGPVDPENFGTLGSSLLSLFQTMTLDSWTSVISPIMEIYPWAWVFFVPFILVATFMVLNLFIAVIVNATQSLGREEEAAHHEQVLVEVRQLREQVSALQASLTSAEAPDPERSRTEKATAVTEATRGD